jgi:hypothetical protein
MPAEGLPRWNIATHIPIGAIDLAPGFVVAWGGWSNFQVSFARFPAAIGRLMAAGYNAREVACTRQSCRPGQIFVTAAS